MTYKYITDSSVAKIDVDGISRMSCSIEDPVYLAWLAEGNVPEPADPVPLPLLVATKYKLRLALLQFGLLDDVEAFIEATDNRVAKIAWEYADEYRSDDPLAIGLGYALGKTDAEIRAVFELANSL